MNKYWSELESLIILHFKACLKLNKSDNLNSSLCSFDSLTPKTGIYDLIP